MPRRRDDFAMHKTLALSEVEHALEQIQEDRFWSAVVALHRAIGSLLRAVEAKLGDELLRKES